MAKDDLMRLALDANGHVWPDLLHKAPGRGGYLCMRAACLRRLSDKGLERVWRDARIPAGEAEALRARMKAQLPAMVQQLIRMQKARLAVGREAAKQRLYRSAPATVVLAEDAGQALTRQITAAVQKHGKAARITFPSAAMLGAALGRGPVAVVVMDTTPVAQKIQRYCNWYIQFMESR